MKKISLKNLNGVEILTKHELIKVEGGKAARAKIRCELMNGEVVDCQTQTALACIEFLTSEGKDVGGCWSTTPLPDVQT